MPATIQMGASSNNYREFVLVDNDGAPITGQAASVVVRLLVAGVSSLGLGAVTEPDAANHPGLYYYTFAASEINSVRNGLLRPSLAGAVPADYPYSVVDLDARIAQIDAVVDAILVDTDTTLDDKVDAINALIAAIKAKTDQLIFSNGAVDANVERINNTEVIGAGTTGNRWRPV